MAASVDGGVVTGSYQPTPSPAFDGQGNSLAGRITVPATFFGVRFGATELRRALDDAAAGRTGTLTDRLLLLCAHFDPRLGRHDAAVMWMLRTIGLALALGLALYAWRRRDGTARR